MITHWLHFGHLLPVLGIFWAIGTLIFEVDKYRIKIVSSRAG